MKSTSFNWAEFPREIADLKEIAVAGLAGIDGPTISIYNDLGVVAGAAATEKAFVIELIVPLRCLRITPGSNRFFEYTLRANGIPPPPAVAAAALAPPMSREAANALFEMDSDTFCSGIYTLAVK